MSVTVTYPCLDVLIAWSGSVDNGASLCVRPTGRRLLLLSGIASAVLHSQQMSDQPAKQIQQKSRGFLLNLMHGNLQAHRGSRTERQAAQRLIELSAAVHHLQHQMEKANGVKTELRRTKDQLVSIPFLPSDPSSLY